MRTRLGCLALMVVLVAVSIAVVAIVATEVAEDEPAWVNVTSCADWMDGLSSADRAEAAADILGRARELDGLSAPSSELVDRYRAEITGVCRLGGERTFIDAAAGVYVTQRGLFGAVESG